MPNVAVAIVGVFPRLKAMEDASSPAAEQTADGSPDPMDEAAFRAFYESSAPALRAYLARVSGNRTLADDLLQEAFLRLLRARFVGSSDAHTRNYLFRIATNLLHDHFRRPRRDTAPLPESAAAPETLSALDLRQDFQRAFGALSPRERAMLWLAYVEGSSHQEIAAIVDVKAASIKAMLFRARSRLAERLRAKGLAPTGRIGGTR
jgi:RNA polymerase sigma-70 factor (ECF subfamily)